VVFIHNVLQLLVTVNNVPSSLILFTLMMEAIRSFETLVLTGATQRHVTECCILLLLLLLLLLQLVQVMQGKLF
jgi:hypothetical protein